MSTTPTIIWMTYCSYSLSFFLFTSLSRNWFLARSLRNSRRCPLLSSRATSSRSYLQSSVLWPCVPWNSHTRLGFLCDGSDCTVLGHMVSLILPMVDTMSETLTLKLYSDNRGVLVGPVYLSNSALFTSPQGFWPRSILRSFRGMLRLGAFLRSSVYGWYLSLFGFGSFVRSLLGYTKSKRAPSWSSFTLIFDWYRLWTSDQVTAGYSTKFCFSFFEATELRSFKT